MCSARRKTDSRRRKADPNDVEQWRVKASRLLAMATAARKRGKFDFAAILVGRATEYLERVAVAERDDSKE
jgi:hypothetical protein